MTSKLSTAIFLAVVFSLFHIQAVTWAVPVPAGTPILIVDGLLDDDSTVTPDVVNPIPGFTFGQVVGGVFSSIIANTTSLAGGTLVDFAIQNNGNTSQVFSLTNPGISTVTANLSGPSLSGKEEVPVLVGDYFNTLTLEWNVFGTLFNFQVLNAGPTEDGFAAVPIPPVAILFGTGLIGLIGIARRNLFVK